MMTADPALLNGFDSDTDETFEISDERQIPIFIHSEIDDMALSVNAFRVYAHLARRAGQDNDAWPSYRKIGLHCFRHSLPTASVETLRRRAIEAVAELVGAGLVVKTRRINESGDHGRNHYVLVSLGGGANAPGSANAPGGALGAPNGAPLGAATKGTPLGKGTPQKKGKKGTPPTPQRGARGEPAITEGGEGQPRGAKPDAAAETLRQPLTPAQLALKQEMLDAGLSDAKAYQIAFNYPEDYARGWLAATLDDLAAGKVDSIGVLLWRLQQGRKPPAKYRQPAAPDYSIAAMREAQEAFETRRR